MGDLIQTGAALTSAGGTITNAAAVYLASLQSIHSRRAMAGRLAAVAALLGADDALAIPWESFRPEHATALRARLIESGQRARTINLTLAAVRGVINTARRLEHIAADRAAAICDALRSIKGAADTNATGRALQQSELNRLMAECAADNSPLGVRDAAIIAAMYGAGLRRSEVVSLQMADVQRDKKTYRLTIKGKGAKVRTAYLSGPLAQALGDWLHLRGATGGPLFVRLARGFALDTGAGLTSQSIYKMLHHRATGAGLKAFSPHDLRRTCISNHLDAGTDIATVAAIVGHSSVETTRRYDRRGERAKQNAADNVHIHYERRKGKGPKKPKKA